MQFLGNGMLSIHKIKTNVLFFKLLAVEACQTELVIFFMHPHSTLGPED